MSDRGWTSQLLDGIAGRLDAAGVALWRPAGVYAAGETGIVIAATPPEPERIVCLTSYPLDEHIEQADVLVGVQVRTRGGIDPREVLDLDDAVFDELHGLCEVRLGGVEVVQVYRQSSAPLGRDERDRWERSSNYYVNAMRPTARRPF